jgi:hypothetical protein
MKEDNLSWRKKAQAAARSEAARVQPRPVVANGPTALTVESQEAADREVASRQRLSDEARASDADKKREEMNKAPGKPFQPARDALNKFDEEVRKMRDADREYWKPSEMRRLRDEAAGVARRLEELVTGDAD